LIGKRILDLALTSLGIVVLSPVIALTALSVWMSLGSPVLFRQPRIGRAENTFCVLKFRTMSDAVDEAGRALPDVDRLTAVGRFLRRASLDELPQLWNVLKGEMSLVGPRPLFTSYLPYYTDRERKRHAVRPGLTGLAQVSGRNMLLWDDRLELDAQYVERLSLSLDVSILLKTLFNVALRRGVVAAPGTLQGPLTQYREHREFQKRALR
jgi:lipopolysaccharide/colanic/teichoic acid biosynthesis glycosyltransferase